MRKNSAGTGGGEGRFIRLCGMLLRYRYLEALAVFLLLVLLRVNGSSLGCWQKIVRPQPGSPGTVLAGVPRPVRSDEWEVQIPYYVAQQKAGNPLVNRFVTPSGQNMLVSYDAPVWDISALAKPLSWGFLLLNSDYGLAWYWDLKLILLLLLSYEMGLILTRGSRLVAALGAVWLAFSPAVQWWFMQHVCDILLCMEAMVVTFYYFFRFGGRVPLQLAFGFLFSLSCVGFALTLYPAIQVPLAYLALLLMVLIFIDLRRNIAHKWASAAIAVCSVAFAAAVLLHVLLVSQDAVRAILNTAYPGKRVRSGGGAPAFLFDCFLTNPFLPFVEVKGIGGNASELSAFYNFLPAVVLLLPLLWRRRAGNLKLGVSLCVYSLLCAAYLYVRIPAALAKLTLLSYVTYRIDIAYGVSAVYASLWALAELGRLAARGRGRRWHLAAAGAAALTCAGYLFTAGRTGIAAYVPFWWYAAVSALLTALCYLLAVGCRRVFSALMCALALASGATVNTVTIGTGALTNTALGAEIKAVDARDGSAAWLADGSDAMGVFLYANGVRSLSGVNYYPDFAKWRVLDPEGRDAPLYNRYAHIAFKLHSGPERTTISLLGTDSVYVALREDELPRLGVRYVVSPRNLAAWRGGPVRFQKLYAKPANGYYLFRVQAAGSRKG